MDLHYAVTKQISTTSQSIALNSFTVFYIARVTLYFYCSVFTFCDVDGGEREEIHDENKNQKPDRGNSLYLCREIKN